MEPLTAMIAISAVSALAQAYNSAQASGANRDELARIKASFDAIVPPEFDVSINEPPEYITEKLQGANLDFSRLTPELFRTVGTYAPQAASHVAETNPTLVQGTAASKEGRQAQIEALRGYKQIAKGDNPALRAAIEDAGAAGQQQAQSRTQSLLQDSQRRGGLNSGLSYASMLQGNSDAMSQGAANARAGSLEAYRSKLDAMRISGDMGRQLASDENSVEAQNASVINDFNQRTTKSYQAYLQNRDELANQAKMYNLQAEQGTADKNTALKNQTNQYNQQNQNQLAQQQYGNTRDERNYQNTLAASQAAWSASEKQRQNDMKQTQFNNQTQIANGRAGIGAQQIQMNNADTLQKNNIVSGLGQAAGGAVAADQQNKQWAEYFKSREPKPLATKAPLYAGSDVNWDEDERNKFRGTV